MAATLFWKALANFASERRRACSTRLPSLTSTSELTMAGSPSISVRSDETRPVRASPLAWVKRHVHLSDGASPEDLFDECLTFGRLRPQLHFRLGSPDDLVAPRVMAIAALLLLKARAYSSPERRPAPA